MRQGPAWLGIGAQRSGTTWFKDLLLQHPEVRLSVRSNKELHRLHRTLNKPLRVKKYQRLFDGAGRAGEFTPFYLRALWVPEVARRAVGPKTPIIVLLRDPLDRFESTMRMLQIERARRPNYVPSPRVVRWSTTDAQWGGMYGTQLDCWASFFDRRQFVVLQYEVVKKDPQAAVNLVWERLELQRVRLQNLEDHSSTRTQGLVDWKWPAGLKEALRVAYRPEVDRVAASWGIDKSLWPNF